MDDEKLFEMVDECVGFAKSLLEESQTLYPFAMILDEDEEIQSMKNDAADQEESYELLLEALRSEAQKGQITAVALLARVTIPSAFSPAVPEGIRIHIEEKRSSGEKLAARFLYIPYQLYKTGENSTKVSVRLHDPIPVGFPSEIFV